MGDENRYIVSHLNLDLSHQVFLLGGHTTPHLFHSVIIYKGSLPLLQTNFLCYANFQRSYSLAMCRQLKSSESLQTREEFAELESNNNGHTSLTKTRLNSFCQL